VREISFTQALRETLAAEMQRDKRVLLMGEDIAAYGGAFGVTRGLVDRFGPERVVNTPISELSFVGMAVGAALTGMRPVVEIMFMDFIALAMDPVINMAAKLHYVFGKQAKCPVVIRTACGAGRGYGPTHSQNLEAWFTHVPGLQVVAPASAADAAGLLTTAIRGSNPVLFLEHKMLYGTKENVPFEEGDQSPLPFGRARLTREGGDVTIIGWSWMAHQAALAADELLSHGIKADVVDLRTLVPLDADAIAASVRKTGHVLIVEEAPGTGGFNAEVAFRVFEQAHEYLDAPIRRLTAPDSPVPASHVLEQAWMPGRAGIVRAARELVGR